MHFISVKSKTSIYQRTSLSEKASHRVKDIINGKGLVEVMLRLSYKTTEKTKQFLNGQKLNMLFIK